MDKAKAIERKLSVVQWFAIVATGAVVWIIGTLFDAASREITGKITPSVIAIFAWVYIFTVPLYQIFKLSNEHSKKIFHYICAVFGGLLIFEGIAFLGWVSIFQAVNARDILFFSISFGVGRIVLIYLFINWLPKKTLVAYDIAAKREKAPSIEDNPKGTEDGGNLQQTVTPQGIRKPVLRNDGVVEIDETATGEENVVEKECPRCAEVIKIRARYCLHCGFEYSEAEFIAEQDAFKNQVLVKEAAKRKQENAEKERKLRETGITYKGYFIIPNVNSRFEVLRQDWHLTSSQGYYLKGPQEYDSIQAAKDYIDLTIRWSSPTSD